MVSRKAKKASGRMSFIVVIIVLGLAAVGLNGATSYLRLYFKKLPVSLSQPLKEIPAQLGPWKQVFSDRPLESDIEHVLGTEEYVFRLYADTRLIKAEDLSGVEDADPDKREAALRTVSRLQAEVPQAFISMAVTYYTGMVDTVAHIPDRCMVADGYEPTKAPEVVTWDIKPHSPVTVRYINFEDQTARGAVNKNVSYFFNVNGAYEYDPISGVRMRLQDLRERHGYYAKVELMNQVQDQKAAKTAMADFVSAALPDLEKCWPDWKKIKAEERGERTAAK